MFNLKKTKKAESQGIKRSRGSGFEGQDESEEELDQGQIFKQSIKDKSRKIAKETTKTSAEDDVEHLAREIADEESAEVRRKRIRETGEGSKYLKGIKEAMQQRKSEQIVSRQRLIERRAEELGTVVFESSEFARQKQSESGIFMAEPDGRGESSSGLASSFAAGIESTSEDFSTSKPTENDIASNNGTRSVCLSSENPESSLDDDTNKDSDHNVSMLDRLREMIKSKITKEYLQEQRKKYFERQGISTDA